MNGLELARGYYEEYGKPMLETEFSDLLPLLTVGFVGSGSEHYGFDDETSRDHDFEPGFCIFLPGEDIVSRRQEFLLERAYAKLPKTYRGFARQPLSPVGGNRNGVIRIADFYEKAVGKPGGDLTAAEWLTIPDYALAEAVNGEVFYDGYGLFSSIRKTLSEMPRDIMLKRIAGNLLIMAQSGQYNFGRCLSHGEYEAASLAVTTFVTATVKVAFLLRGRYAPYYKWSFRALRSFEGCETLAGLLSELLFGDPRVSDDAERKWESIEKVAELTIDQLQARGLTKAICGDLEKHAYSVNDAIADPEIRNLHILAAVPD